MITLILLEVIVDPTSTTSLLWWAVVGLIGLVGTLGTAIYSIITKRITSLEAVIVAKDLEIKELTNDIKDMSNDNIKTLNEFGGFIKTLCSNSDRNNVDVRSDIKDIKHILEK